MCVCYRVVSRHRNSERRRLRQYMYEAGDRARSFAGTVEYMSPQMCNQELYNRSVVCHSPSPCGIATGKCANKTIL